MTQPFTSRGPRWIQALCLGALTGLAATAWAKDHIVDIAWRGDGSFDHATRVAPGQFLEVCGKLSKGKLVKWQFEADAPVAFNIHYHQGKDVVFPAKLAQADRAQDVLKVPVDQDYCWMWTNKGKEPVSLKLGLQQ